MMLTGALLLAVVTPVFAQATWWNPPAAPVYTLNNNADIDVTGISKAITGFNDIMGSGTNTIYTGAAQAQSFSTITNVNRTSAFTGNVNNNFTADVFGKSKAITGFNDIMALPKQDKPVLTFGGWGGGWGGQTCNTCGVNLISTGNGAAWTESTITGINVMGF